MFDMQQVGSRISKLRKSIGITQTGLADRLGISFQAVSNWERGVSMPDISKLKELSEIFGVTVDEILGGGTHSELVRELIEKQPVRKATREEIEEIQPAIDEALAEGINIPEKKPTPPDTVFSKAIGGWYDIVVVMYHDQGHIPLKVKGFVYNKKEGHWDAVAGVNVTLGLPIIRASVDHGTGFGHAGNGHANAISLVNAMDYAIALANERIRRANEGK